MPILIFLRFYYRLTSPYGTERQTNGQTGPIGRWNMSAGSRSYPEARRSFVGFQAQINTSDSCPRRTETLLAGISMLLSTSIISGFVAVNKTQSAALYSLLNCLRIQNNIMNSSMDRTSHNLPAD